MIRYVPAAPGAVQLVTGVVAESNVPLDEVHRYESVSPASGSWAVVYLSGSGPVSIRTDWLPGRALVLVYDPRDGSCTTGEVDGASPLAVSVPDGTEDAVVVIGASA